MKVIDWWVIISDFQADSSAAPFNMQDGWERQGKEINRPVQLLINILQLKLSEQVRGSGSSFWKISKYLNIRLNIQTGYSSRSHQPKLVTVNDCLTIWLFSFRLIPIGIWVGARSLIFVK